MRLRLALGRTITYKHVRGNDIGTDLTNIIRFRTIYQLYSFDGHTRRLAPGSLEDSDPLLHELKGSNV